MQQEDKLFYGTSDRFFKELASGATVSGPTPDGLMHITFTAFGTDVKSQTKEYVEEDGERVGYKLYFDVDDTEIGIEALGRCSLTESAYRGLLGAIVDRIHKHGGVDELNSILSDRGLVVSEREDDGDNG